MQHFVQVCRAGARLGWALVGDGKWKKIPVEIEILPIMLCESISIQLDYARCPVETKELIIWRALFQFAQPFLAITRGGISL